MSYLISETTKEEREQIVAKAFPGQCHSALKTAAGQIDQAAKYKD